MASLKVLGMDPSLRHWGLAGGRYCTKTNKLEIKGLDVIESVSSTSKQVRQNSKDLLVASELFCGANSYAKDADITFVEVPIGSQSARAMASYGICIGVLGSLKESGINIIELTPTEVKKASVGKSTATKEQMIEWAMAEYPNANWPMKDVKGVTSVVAGRAEHMADAIATIHAGVQLDIFKQLIHLTNIGK